PKDEAEDEDEEDESEDDDSEDSEDDDEKSEDESEKKSKDKDEKEDPVLSQKVKLKVNGKEVTKSVGELVKEAQRYHGAQEKFEQASRSTKQALEIVKTVKDDPLGTAYRLLAQDHGE